MTSTKGGNLRFIVFFEDAFELVEMPIRLVALQNGDVSGELVQGDEAAGLLEALADLQVRLPVQVGGLDVAHGLGLARGQHQQVGGEEVVVVHLDDVAHLDGVPLHPLPVPVPQHLHFLLVGFTVRAMPFL